MTQSAESIVPQQFNAYNAHDLDRFIETFTSDVEIRRLPEQELFLSGKDEVKQYYRDHRFNYPGLQAILLNRMVLGHMVIDHEQLVGLEPDHVTEAIAIYRVVGEFIQQVWFIRTE